MTLVIGFPDSTCSQCTPACGSSSESGIPQSSLSTMPPNKNMPGKMTKVESLPKFETPIYPLIETIERHLQWTQGFEHMDQSHPGALPKALPWMHMFADCRTCVKQVLPKSRLSLPPSICNRSATKWYKKVKKPSTDFFPTDSSVFFMPFI